MEEKQPEKDDTLKDKQAPQAKETVSESRPEHHMCLQYVLKLFL
jgi:hypothetical protein